MRYFTLLTKEGLIRPFVQIVPASERGYIDPFIVDGDESIQTIFDDEYDKLCTLLRETLKLSGFSDEKIAWLYQRGWESDQSLPAKLQNPTEQTQEKAPDTVDLVPNTVTPVPINETAPAQTSLPHPVNGQSSGSIVPQQHSCAGTQLVQRPQWFKYNSPRTISPIETAELLKEKVPMFVLADELYVYGHNCYVKQSQENAERLIRYHCEDACLAAGRPEFASAVYKSLLQDPHLCITEQELENYYIAFADGQLLDLRTGRTQAATPRIRSTYALNCQTPAAKYICPCFDQVMANITHGDPILYRRFMEVLGYLFSGDTRGKCVFLFQGVSNSGKSLLIRMLLHCFTQDQKLTMDLLAMGERFALANLQGVRINVCHDMSAELLSTDVVRFIKTITGDEELTSDQKYKRAVHFTHRTRLVMVTNYAVRTKYPEEAALLEARTVTLPFAYSVPKEQWDHELAEKLAQDLPAVLYRALQAYYTLVQNKYVFSGNYPMNAVTSCICSDVTDSFDALLDNFIEYHVASEPNAVLHLDDALEQFCCLYGTQVTAAQFSSRFKQLAINRYGAVAAKVRREGCGNPISSLRHVKLL